MEYKHLWEVEHNYYCCPYHDDIEIRESWQDFLEEIETADLDYNLFFRWDWEFSDNEDGSDGRLSENLDLKNGLLKLFFVAQRKGFIWQASIQVCRNDEESIKNWIENRLKYLVELWSPITVTRELPKSEFFNVE